MASTQVLLIKPVAKLGGEGEEVKVRAGYARNFLFPQKIAIPVTKANRKQIEALNAARERREAQELEEARQVAEKIGSARVALAMKTGEGGKMFGAVTAVHLQEKLKEAGLEVDRKAIQLSQPIKELGSHTVEVKLHPEVSAELSFDIVSENAIVENEEA
ncbi:MAG: 50S ribosomal protein L9 [Opitutales bacterium]|nr:50S ribosomal protein L9 [Opitutales bacterium]MCH8539309.1 50S ribosomal protein L9 [Opitutales bacterium]